MEDNPLVVKVVLRRVGVDPDRDVDIDIHEGSLHIRAQRRHQERKKDKGCYYSEFRDGAFSRVIPLAAGAKDEDVTASYKDGILEVRVLLDPRSKTGQRIAIEPG